MNHDLAMTAETLAELDAPQRGSEWRQHWPMLLVATAGMMLCTVHVYTLGVMVAPLEREFGWSRTQIFSGPLILALTGLFVTPMIGSLVDRIGPRRVGLIGVPVFCCSVALLSTATASPASWWVLWFVVSLASILCGPMVWAAGLNSRFVKNRGLALALALCGTGAGGAFIPALTEAFIGALGWRQAYIAIGALAAVITVPLVLFAFHPLGQAGSVKAMFGKSGGAKRAQGGRSLYFQTRYVKLALAMLLFGFPVSGVIVNSVPILSSNGFTQASAAALAGVIGIGAIIGRLVGGYLLDRLNASKVTAVAVMLPAVSGLLLLSGPTSPVTAGAAFMVLGLAVGTELDACAYLTAQYFGMRNFGALYGMIMGLLVFSNGLSPLIASFIYDKMGSYMPIMWASVPCALLSGLLLFSLGKPPASPDADPV
ncbi:hypothetical protein C100_08410 [Sphingobium sp. C100]|uniref:MFS transporter n=1 Tax=Sphingobium sp. C100 TaxID=1207055 RepID=UPI0003D68B77|nr:MFS transporter [Sphingobium sp. C100]ETI64261.1 hypothetical protein C100_08410 [Sphingobium sp. C100]